MYSIVNSSATGKVTVKPRNLFEVLRPRNPFTVRQTDIKADNMQGCLGLQAPTLVLTESTGGTQASMPMPEVGIEPTRDFHPTGF